MIELSCQSCGEKEYAKADAPDTGEGRELQDRQAVHLGIAEVEGGAVWGRNRL